MAANLVQTNYVECIFKKKNEKREREKKNLLSQMNGCGLKKVNIPFSILRSQF